MNLLGHVAKGVSGAVFGSNPEGYNPEDAAVEGLLSRISDGVLSEDRHDALVALRDLLIDNPQAQLAVGAMGFPVLAEVLREDREDVELLQGALEVLINACGPPPASHGDTHARKEVFSPSSLLPFKLPLSCSVPASSLPCPPADLLLLGRPLRPVQSKPLST